MEHVKTGLLGTRETKREALECLVLLVAGGVEVAIVLCLCYAMSSTEWCNVVRIRYAMPDTGEQHCIPSLALTYMSGFCL